MSEWIEVLFIKRCLYNGVKIKLVIGKVKVRNLLLKVLIVFIYYDNLNKFIMGYMY